nr:MAG TPA: hypothetical protein [Caudoviricetes sp.]
MSKSIDLFCTYIIKQKQETNLLISCIKIV